MRLNGSVRSFSPDVPGAADVDAFREAVLPFERELKLHCYRRQREAVELAFIAALQTLPPRQTAAVLLCDVLGYSVAEAGSLLSSPATVVKGTLQRVRALLERRRSRPAALVERGDAQADAELARRFAEALTGDDIDGVLALLTDDAWLAMPPAPHEYLGRAEIESFYRSSIDWKGARSLRLLETSANTQPAFGAYLSDLGSPTAKPTGIIVLTLVEGRIGAITAFHDQRLPGVFGLPPWVGGDLADGDGTDLR